MSDVHGAGPGAGRSRCDVRAFGALGDGRTVATAAMQAATNASAGAGGRCVAAKENYPVMESRYGGYVGDNAAAEAGAFSGAAALRRV